MKRFKTILTLLIITLFLSSCTKNKEIERTEFMMDTVIKVKLKGIDDQELMDEIFTELDAIEKDISKTLKSSYISKINKEAGKNFVEVNDRTLRLIEDAKNYAEITDGIFDPSIGPLVSLWDIQREQDKDRQWIPSDDEINEYKNLVDYKKISIEDNLVKLIDENMQLDMGAITKGYAADRIKDILIRNEVTDAIIDLGGNIYVHGNNYNEDWKIGIRNPLDDQKNHLGILTISDKSVVTSGAYERFFKIGDQVFHHIIDPRTGYPAESDLMSVTIVSDNSTVGDTYSTTLYILGLDNSIELLNQNKDLDAILVTKSNDVYITKFLEGKFKINDNFNLKVLE